MTARTIALLAIIAGLAVLVFVYGHHRGRRSCRNEYPDGWDQGQQAERERWEQATGTTWDALAAWNNARPPDPGAEWEAWEHHGEAPSTEVLLTAANEQLGKPVIRKFEGQLSDAEADEWKARWEAAQRTHFRMPITPATLREHIEALGGTMEPIVADLTGPDAWHYPGEDDVPTLTGLIVTPPHRTGPEWLECQIAAMDAETAAYLRRVEAECVSFRRGISAGART